PQSEVEEEQQVEEVLTTLSSCQESSFHSSVLSPDIVSPRVTDEIRERGVIVREKQAKSEDISDDIMAFRAMIEREQSESIILQGSSGLSILLQLLATENAPTEFIHILQEMKKASAEDDNHVPSEVEQRGGGEIVPLRVVNEIRRMANTATEKQAKSEDISDDIAAFRALIEREPLKSITISMWDGTFSTLLHLLAKQNAPVEFIRILVELSPASLNVQESGWVTFPNTPLLWAIANASNTAAAELLKHRQNLNLVANGNTALHLSVGKGYKNISEDGEPLNPSNHELARQLVAFGADCSIQNNEGNTPLHLACLRRDKEMIGILLAHPGIARSVNTRNHEGETPLDMLKKSYGEAFGLLQATVHAFLLDNEIFETTERAEIEKLFAPFTV
ncbi:MAG TPA: ankyrin repeat domain-containing protein, partial [Chlamydiales bacterium]|nr:ankyrin repeat domain-containing protein [Chlamydiales bacterium]